jgi:putative hydrolase of the HAD superfamily
MDALRALVFDLDDTLFPEAAFVRSGFRAVADWLDQAGILPAQDAFAAMWAAHARGERGRIFNGLLERCRGAAGRTSVPELVAVYRSHPPDIAFFPGMPGLLDQAKARSLRIAVISDGFLAAQRQKVRALQLSRWADPILLTDQWGRPFWKPDPRAFLEVQAAFGLDPDQLVYIGDNPAKDFQAPNALGWQTIQLVLPDQGRPGRPVAPARIRVDGVQELRALLLAPC